MDDFLALVMVIMAVVSAIAKNKKKKTAFTQKKAAKKLPTMETLAGWFDEPESAQPKAPAAQATAASAKPASHEGVHPCVEHDNAAVKVVQPRIQTRVQVKEKPLVVAGSLQQDTHEGLHPCDEHDDETLQAMKPMAPVPVEQPGIQLDWSGENMVKAFIMQEVLTRPCDRRRRA